MNDSIRLMNVLEYNENATDFCIESFSNFFFHISLNELLQEHNSIDKQHFFTRFTYSFSPNCCYFAITGLKKAIYHGQYGITPQEYRSLCRKLIPLLGQVFKECGYGFEIFLITVDGSKQLGIFFSPQDDCAITTQELGKRLLDVQQTFYGRHIFHGDGTYAVQFAMTGPISGVADFRPAYLHTRSLSDAAFFHMETAQITDAFINEHRQETDYFTVMESCRSIVNALSAGDENLADAQLHRLFLQTLKYSFDFSLVREALSFLKNAFHTRAVVYDRDTLPIDSCCELSSHLTIEACFQSLRSLTRDLCHVVQTQGAYQEPVILAIGYIKRHYSDSSLSLTKIADYAFVGHSHLSRLFNSQTGCSIHEYIRQTRLKASLELLISTSQKIHQIAAAVGIPDSRYFSSLFKAEYGLTPQQYRQEHMRH